MFQARQGLIVLLAPLIVATVGLRRGAQDDQMAAQAAEIEKSYELLSERMRALPRDEFDPAGIVEQVGRDAGALREWTKANTRWVPYRGALRGAVGVLNDRVGSSLDRALLLAELLRLAGHEARLAHAALDEGGVQTVLQAGRAQGPPADPAKTVATNAVILKRVEDHASKLTAALGAAGLGTTPPDPAAAAASAQDYWWVQRRQGDQWVDMHLADVRPEAAETFEAPGPDGVLRLPEEHVHLLIVRVIIEAWDAGTSKLEDRPVIETHVRAAEAPGVRVTLRHYPMTLSEDPGALSRKSDEATLKAAALAQTEWIPVLERRGTKVALRSFTDTGEVNTLPSMPVAAQVGGAAARVLGGIDGALGGGGEEAAAANSGSVLTAEWLELTIQAPGQESQVVRRMEFDLIGPAARAGGVSQRPVFTEQQRLERARLLAGVTESLVIGFMPARRYDLFRAAQELLVQRQTWQKVLSEPDAERRTELAIDLDSRGAPLVAMGAARRSFSPARDRVYIGSINVLSCKSHVVGEASGADSAVLDQMDLALSETAGGDFAERVAQGVADCAAESAVLHGAEASPRNTLGLLEPGRSAPQLVVVRDAESADRVLRALAPSEDVRARVLSELGRGFVVVLPSQRNSADAAMGWWRVEPGSGSTVGVMDNGYHGDDTAEYTVVKAANPLDKTFVPQRAPSFWRRNAHQIRRDLGGHEDDFELLEMIVDLQEKMRLSGIWL